MLYDAGRKVLMWFLAQGSGRRPPCRSAALEPLETRVLLAAGVDIQMQSATSDGLQTLTLRYEIAGDPAGPFEIGLYRSDDGVFDAADELLSSVAISDPADLAVGTHVRALAIGPTGHVVLPGAGADETAADYRILAVADPLNAVAEDDADPLNEDNTVALVGAYHPVGGDVFVHGTAQADTILMAPGRKTLDLSLNGTLVSYAPKDVTGFHVRSHEGDDTVSGPKIAQPIQVWAGAGNDALTGGPGGDRLDGGAGNDQLFGLAGADALFGGDGDDSLDGGAGNDLLDGGSGADMLVGGAGDDFLDGGPGVNVLTGGAGKDTWAMQGSDGADTLTVDGTLKTATGTIVGLTPQQDTFTDLSAALDLVSVGGGDGDDTLTVLGKASAALYGGEGNDTLTGGSGKDYLNGGPGDDQLFGMAGDDWLFGGSGNDTLDGGLGNDTIIGSGGTDIVRPGPGRNTLVFSGLGDATSQYANLLAASNLASGPTVSFQTTVTLKGSLFGFGGSATANVSVTGTLDENGVLTGSMIASGSGGAAGRGATVAFDFTASGGVSGPLKACRITAGWSGSGTVYYADGSSYPGSMSGGWSGTVSLAGAAGSQRLKADSGGGFTGAMPVCEFTTTSDVDDAIGGPSAVVLSALSKWPSKGYLSSVYAAPVLWDPRVIKSLPHAWGTVYAQLDAQANGRPIYSPKTGKLTLVDPGVFGMIRRLADDFGGVTLNDLAAAGHGPNSRHYKGLAVDFGSIGEWNFKDVVAPEVYKNAVIGMYEHGDFISGKRDHWEVGVGIGKQNEADLQKIVQAFCAKGNEGGGTLIPGKLTSAVDEKGNIVLYSMMVTGKDQQGNKVNIKFLTDGPSHLHIGLPKS
jgi:Ca2+-binding RTX toxin-like protein